MSWWWGKKAKALAGPIEDRIRSKYLSFRDLLSLNNQCLELMAGLQEDLQVVPPRRDVLGNRIVAIYKHVEGTVAALERLTGMHFPQLREAVQGQQNEVERYVAACQELTVPRLSAWLSEVAVGAASEVGGKAAALGEVKTRLGLPVPDGYVLTTEAYRQFCGIPLWVSIRDTLRDLDLSDLAALQAVSTKLQEMIMACPVPRAVEIAITARAENLETGGLGLAVRSSALGEGGERSFAGQFLSLLNVPPDQVVDAYKRVVAGRFSERAIFYRLSTGMMEVESPMAVLFLPMIRARAAGIMYTRDPNNSGRKVIWVTAIRGLGLEIASGRMPADLFVISRGRQHEILEQTVVRKNNILALADGGGLRLQALDPGEADAESLDAAQLKILAAWGVRIEDHFKAPQDIEWALGEDGKLWILQVRPLTLAGRTRGKLSPRAEPLLTGGRTVYPGRVSGQVYLLEELRGLKSTPDGAILVLPRASPEIIQVFPRLSGLIAEWGNVTGHAAALLREFKVPSVFQMEGAFKRLKTGDAVSLDAVQSKVYPGALWPPRMTDVMLTDGLGERASDPIHRRLLALHLVDPDASNFRPSGCKSAHDVLRFCHEKAIGTMFAINDLAMERGAGCAKQLVSDVPVHIYVLDLGGGLATADPGSPQVKPSEVISAPFQALWKGISHPAVTWTRRLPASLSDLASVLAGTFSSQAGTMRALGEESYLLVAAEYMNLNTRLAYHFSLIDACLSDAPSTNYISFRFVGGGATRQRRNLRACFIEACLIHYGFRVDRRGDLVNAWLKKAPAEETGGKLDILGRLMACASQLDMYMTSHEVMKWYVQQFLEGNYHFQVPGAPENDASRL